MKIDALFIPSAGTGSRMGRVGEVLPKPLWPVFGKTLLELQFDFYRWMDIGTKIVNTHHRARMVEEFVRSYDPGIRLLHEPRLLGVGGAIINLKGHCPEVKSLLVSNVDQFSCISGERIAKEIDEIEHFDVILFAMPVDQGWGYGKLQISPEGTLLGIDSSPGEDRYWSYSGVALINCTSLPRESGRAGFFQSVAAPGKRRVKVVAEGNWDYYDFGTLERYFQQVADLFYRIEKGEKGAFLNFLKESHAIPWA